MHHLMLMTLDGTMVATMLEFPIHQTDISTSLRRDHHFIRAPLWMDIMPGLVHAAQAAAEAAAGAMEIAAEVAAVRQGMPRESPIIKIIASTMIGVTQISQILHVPYTKPITQPDGGPPDFCVQNHAMTKEDVI